MDLNFEGSLTTQDLNSEPFNHFCFDQDFDLYLDFYLSPDNVDMNLGILYMDPDTSPNFLPGRDRSNSKTEYYSSGKFIT
jgi:hypothetical protein